MDTTAPLIWQPGPGVRVTAARHAFRTETLTLEMEAGATLAAMAEAAGIPSWAPAHAWIDDVPVPRALWPRVRPRPGRRVLFRVVPGGGGGGGDSNKTLRIVLLVVILIIAIAITVLTYGATTPIFLGLSGAVLGQIAATAVLVGGALAVNMLLPPPKPKLSAMSQPFFGAPSPTYSLTGTRNQLAPYQVVPRLYGRHRLYPPLGGYPITQPHDGSEQQLQQAFTLGYGPLKMEEYKIGDTLISSYQGVALEIREGWPTDTPLSSIGTVRIEDVMQVLLENEVPQERAGRPHADWLSIDIAFPQGLYYVPDWDPQHWHPLTVSLSVSIRELNPDGTPVGSGAWLPAFEWTLTEGRRESLRFVHTVNVPHRGYWAVQVVKHGPTPVPDNWASVAVWTALRSIRAEDPMPLPGMAKVGLTIEASGQLSGVVDQFNVVATSYLSEWIDGAWQVVPSRNPAAVFLDMLRGSANARPVPDAELDFAAIIEWMDECRAKGYTFDAVYDTQSTVFEALQNVAAAGRASFTMRDGKYSVVRDRPQAVPVQFFTPRNSWGFNGTKVFTDMPHALRVKFINPASQWQLDERLVYDDGFDETNATKFEGLEIFGCTSPELAWKHGRYWIAAARLRPEVYELQTDVEYLVSNRGDLVHINHDVPLWGLASARVLALGPIEGATGTTVVIDELLDHLEPGTLALRVRLRDGQTYVGPVSFAPDPAQRVTRLISGTALEGVEPGDLVMLGSWGEETVPCIIKSIEPGDNLSAKLTLVDAAPAIHSADTGPIPPFDSHITRPPTLNREPPPAPQVLTVRSDETVMDAGAPRIVVAFTVPVDPAAVPATHVQGQYRPTGSQAPWLDLPSVTMPGDQLIVAPVIQGVAYDVRLRSLNAPLGRVSAWVLIEAHTVVGLSTIPADVQGLTLDVELVELRWYYPTPPPDFAGFLVRYAQGAVVEWELAQPLHDGLVSDTRFHVPPLTGLYTFMVKAVDTSGNESLLPARLVTDMLAGLPNILEEIDWAAAGFPGELVNLDRTAGAVCPRPATDPLFWTLGANPPFWKNDTAAFWATTYGPGTYTTTLTPPAEHVGAALTWSWASNGPGWLLEYRNGGDSLYWTNNADDAWTTDPAPAWVDSSTWLSWPGAVVASAQPYEFRWRYLGNGGACLTSAVAGFEVPDIDEYLNDVAVSVAGTRLPIAQDYRAITTVLLTVLQGAPGDALRIATVLDKNPEAGPLVALNLLNGSAVAGVVDAHIRGY